MKGFVYGLSHGGEIRYVGRSTRSLRTRLSRHLREARQSEAGKRHVFDWIRSVGFDVQIVKLEQDPFDLDAAERAWIDTLRRYGCQLTNVAAGGVGVVMYGRVPWNKGMRGVSDETRARMSESARARDDRPIWSDERRRQMSEFMKTSPQARAMREKGRTTQRATQMHTPDARRKAGAANKKRWANYTSEERQARGDAIRAGIARAKQCRAEGVMPL